MPFKLFTIPFILALSEAERLAKRVFLVAGIGIFVAGCAENRGPELLHPSQAAALGSKQVEVFAATTRQRSVADRRDFTSNRNYGLNYNHYVISIPPNHAVGQIEWPQSFPGDAESNFVVSRTKALDTANFASAVAKSPENPHDVIIFVHGYKTNFQEAVFRAAQLKADTGAAEPVVVFAWPSLGTFSGYAADRESATFSRDYLEQVLDDIASKSRIRRIHIVAHSMGSWVVMETLRQAKLRSRSTFIHKLGQVWLMSPDIDVDVFATQLSSVGKLNPPITLAISTDDRALALSQWLGGNVARVGNFRLEEARVSGELLQQFGLRVIDMSKISDTDITNHGKFAFSIQTLSEIYRNENRSLQRPSLAGAGLVTLKNAEGIIEATIP